MALIVETGSGSSSSESYASVAEADAYHLSIGNTPWAGITETEKEQALRRAMAHLTITYRKSWQGYRAFPTQALDWPRYGVYLKDANTVITNVDIPKLLKDALCDIAILAAAGELNPALGQGVLSKQVGPIKITYDGTSPRSKQYVAVDAKLSVFLKLEASGAMRRLVRV